MDLIRAAIDRPTAVIAAVLMVVMFGWVALNEIPIQLTPDVRQPVITVTTNWFGAAPAEVEREVVNRQEEALKGLEGLEEMTSTSRQGTAEVTLEFGVAQNMDRALLLVANRLDRVSGYPDEADEPTLSTSGSDDRPIAWFVVRRLPGNERQIDTYGDFMDDVVRDRVERVAGVSRVNVYGGSAREMRITVDPDRMARYGLTVPEIVDALWAANVSLSAGEVNEGKRRYVVRVEGQFERPEDVERVLLRAAGDGGAARGGVARVTVGDVAAVDFGYKDPTARIRHLGEPTIPFNAVAESGANVIETMAGIRVAIAELNAGPLAERGLTVTQVYDETVYINSAIDLVVQNIYVGGLLAATVLIVFLRRLGPTVIITLAIPVSVIGAFVGMAALGRSLNVISLAGIAFAVGMVVDAAIVVLENIYRHRELGFGRVEAAYRGAKQVWGAILVSALTTVMVFIPILILDLEIGQLFRDIAVAISVAVLLSLLVAVTVIPALSKRLLGDVRKDHKPFRLPLIDGAARGFAGAVTGLAAHVSHNKVAAAALVVAMTTAAAAATWLLLPKLEYLPEGNRNLVFGIILPPPGYNLETTAEIARGIENAVRPLWAVETGPEPDEGGPPKIENFFFVARESTAFFGASAVQESRAAELIPVLRGPVFMEPGTFGFITQPSLFGRSIGGGRAIDLNITGDDLGELIGVALRAAGLVSQALPREAGHQLRPQPGLELGAPEVRVYPDPVRLADAGVSARAFAETVDSFNDGLRVAEITVDGDRIDLMLAGPEAHVTRTQGIAALPVVTPAGQILPAGALARVEVTAGPTEILHTERARTITLQIRPATELPLESAMEILQAQVMGPLVEQGIPPGVSLALSGTADELTEAWNAMVWQLMLAMAIVYLVMAVLFESFLYPLVIMVTVPLASAGAVLGLALLNVWIFQALDMLTLLGFVVLVGIVVNNAILLVHQTLHHIRTDGWAPEAAIEGATGDRVRPIFMSTLTSLFGMAPLVVFPGAGSELYRGLGAVVLGGLALSAVLTLVIIPPLLSLVVGVAEGSRTGRRDTDAEDGGEKAAAQ